jgi:ABC-2 type transport system ATP-binding protein
MIEVRQLTKYYGEHAAIRDLSFDIKRGEVIGFLGLNGAGKTTTLKILGCLLLPTSGKVVVDGVDVLANPHEVRKKIGFLPDLPPLYGEMTVGSYLTFAARLRGVSAKDAPARVSEVEEKTALREVHDEMISSLSHGYRQRVGLAQALVHRPALLILDEPTAGLDPVQIVEMRSLIRRLRGEHTLLISSHFLAEISQTCDRLLVIQSGEIVAQGTEQELGANLGTSHEVEVTVKGSAARAQEAARGVLGVSKVEVVQDVGGEVSMRISALSDIRAQLARTLVLAGLDLLRFDRGATRLESIFIQLARTGSGDGADGNNADSRRPS